MSPSISTVTKREQESEARVSSQITLCASRLGRPLWRNNVGSLVDKRGIPVRFGLCNDSKKVNQKIKSSDRIGVTPVRYGERMFGVFTAIETKESNWSYKNTEHEQAQLSFINIVRSLGGIAGFAKNEADYHNIIEEYLT